MKCPRCEGEKQKVLQSRPFGEETRRIRKCSSCNFTFTTYEKVEELEEKGVENAKIN